MLQEVNSDKEEAKPIDFKIEDCLEYIKSGMEAIIEDDVTSRFEAEELKNWNLLIRTNRGYEFISWKLTVLWFVGFLIRYLILMPLRVIICFIGVSFKEIFDVFSSSFRHFSSPKKVLWFSFSFTFVSLIPHEKLRRWCNDKSSLIGFRIFSRSLSTVINIYNDEYKPKRCGFCVANHTSPIDIVILSTDCTYSLVSTRMLSFKYAEICHYYVICPFYMFLSYCHVHKHGRAFFC